MEGEEKVKIYLKKRNREIVFYSSKMIQGHVAMIKIEDTYLFVDRDKNYEHLGAI